MDGWEERGGTASVMTLRGVSGRLSGRDLEELLRCWYGWVTVGLEEVNVVRTAEPEVSLTSGTYHVQGLLCKARLRRELR